MLYLLHQNLFITGNNSSGLYGTGIYTSGAASLHGLYTGKSSIQSFYNSRDSLHGLYSPTTKPSSSDTGSLCSTTLPRGTANSNVGANSLASTVSSEVYTGSATRNQFSNQSNPGSPGPTQPISALACPTPTPAGSFPNPGSIFSSLPPLSGKEGLLQPHNLPCSLPSTLPFNFRQHYSYLQSYGSPHNQCSGLFLFGIFIFV